METKTVKVTLKLTVNKHSDHNEIRQELITEPILGVIDSSAGEVLSDVVIEDVPE